MARITVQFFSEALGVETSIEMIVPDTRDLPGRAGDTGVGPDLPALLYLLHGLSDDQTKWTRMTSVERYAARYNLVVVMPGVGRSFYRDMAHGYAYGEYVTREVPALVERVFRVATDRDHTFVAGLSMGGYGAMRLGLSAPDRFAAIGAFSAVMDVRGIVRVGLADPEIWFHHDMALVFGSEDGVQDTDDLFALAASAATLPSPPAVYIACGTEDELIASNNRMAAHLSASGLEHTYVTEPGAHEWGFWDRHIDRYLRFLEERGLLRAT